MRAPALLVVMTARLVVMMVRPPVAVVLLLFAALGTATGGAGGDDLHPLFTTVLVVVAGWFVNATVLNDLADEPIDRINLREARGRPLVSGHATRRQLLAVGLAAGAVALATAFAVDWRVALVVAAGMALSAAYSLPPVRLCGRGALASLLLPLGYVALPFLVGALSVRPRITGEQVMLLAGLYVTFIGRILLKDFRDVRGDAQYGKRTFLVRHGRTATLRASAACWVAGTASLLFLIPVRSLLTAVFAAFLACALHGLRRLATADQPTAEQVVIGAVASVGRGMAITLLAYFTMVNEGWTPLSQGLVLLTITVLFLGLYRSILAKQNSPVAVRPY